MIRVVLPEHLRNLAKLESEAELNGEEINSITSLLNTLEAQYPMLKGTIRDHNRTQRRPFIRFFACGEDLSHDSYDAMLPEAVLDGKEPFLIVGAMAGG